MDTQQNVNDNNHRNSTDTQQNVNDNDDFMHYDKDGQYIDVDLEESQLF